MKSQLLILLRILCMQWITPPWWSQILPLFLSFNNLFTMCLGGSLSLFYWSWLIVFDVQIVFHEIWGVFGHYVFTYSILSLLSFCDHQQETGTFVKLGTVPLPAHTPEIRLCWTHRLRGGDEGRGGGPVQAHSLCPQTGSRLPRCRGSEKIKGHPCWKLVFF